MIDVASLKARTDLAQVVGHYVPLQKRGREFVGRCVWHSPDEHPSMWVTDKGFVHCFACGANSDVIGFVQHMEHCDFAKACELLGATDDWAPSISLPPRIERPNRITGKPPNEAGRPDMTIRGLGQPSEWWPYLDSDGLPLGYVARYETDAGKEIRCWTWGQAGNEAPGWACGHWNRPRPLYALNRLADRPTVPVIVVEGEKAADAAGELLPAYVAITWPGGSYAYDRADWEPLRGRTVLLWPDADEPGVQAMAELGLMLVANGLTGDVSVLDVAGMPDGWDAADSEAAGMSGADVIQWARPRKAPLRPATVTFPPIPEAGIDSGMPPEPPYTESANPVMDDLPERTPVPKGRSGRAKLSVVGGRGYEGAAAVDPDDEPLPLELSESGMADELAAGLQADMRYVPEWRERGWLVWTGSRWKREPRRNTAMQRMRVISHGLKYRAAAAALQPASKGRLESKAYCGNVLDFAESDRRLLATPQQWDSDPYLLGVPGGTVDLRTGDMRDCLPEHYITRQTSVAPLAGPTPLFDRVLAQATDGDAAMLAYIWRWLGYCLCGSTKEEAFLFLYGPPACGKTTLIEAIAAILGDSHESGYAVKTTMDLFIESKYDKGAGRFHVLHGARFAHAAETEEGRHWKAAMIKEATGGDTMIGERKYENEFSFKPTHKLVIHGNHRPHMRQADEGLRRRMHIVEYRAGLSKSEQDTTLKDRLVAEYPAILFRMIQGCLDWQRSQLAAPEAVSKAVDDYYEAEDSFGAWLVECTQAKPHARLSSTGAYNNFKDWLTDRGEHPPSHKRFTSLMTGRGFGQIKSGGAKFFRDVELSANQPATDWRD